MQTPGSGDPGGRWWDHAANATMTTRIWKVERPVGGSRWPSWWPHWRSRLSASPPTRTTGHDRLSTHSRSFKHSLMTPLLLLKALPTVMGFYTKGRASWADPLFAKRASKPEKSFNDLIWHRSYLEKA